MKTNYMLGGRDDLAELQAALARERNGAVASVIRAIRSAETSGGLNADIREETLRSLKNALAKLQKLDPEAPFAPGPLSDLVRPIISMSQSISLSQNRPWNGPAGRA